MFSASNPSGNKWKGSTTLRYFPALENVEKIRILIGLRTDRMVYEREIDQLVYDLYGLTEEEIAIVEGTAK